MELFEFLIMKYGYIAIIIILVGGIVGLPIPDEVLLTLIGYYTYLGKMSYVLALLSAFLGSAIGISISYFLGAKLGLPFLMKYGPRFHISHKKIDYTQRLFYKYGPILLFIGYFIPGVRHITGYLSGISKYKFTKFSLFAYTGAFAWVFIFITLGQELGSKWYIVERYFLKIGLVLFILLILISIYLIVRYNILKKRLDKK
ncbi:DedA family protein [Alkalihalobacterium elongatum]|uniref:DedA family protein n=1 Tax=Alkalihalobacterium elongatum TaxID=2675466 RepID=UPI001C1F8B97|nr:DedA family protein [Alkalihalobacterium elongatum]